MVEDRCFLARGKDVVCINHRVDRCHKEKMNCDQQRANCFMEYGEREEFVVCDLGPTKISQLLLLYDDLRMARKCATEFIFLFLFFSLKGK